MTDCQQSELCQLCELCDCCFEENDEDKITYDCKHKYHISYLINYCSDNGLNCPNCKTKIDDIRLSVAVAFKKGGLSELIDVLKP